MECGGGRTVVCSRRKTETQDVHRAEAHEPLSAGKAPFLLGRSWLNDVNIAACLHCLF